MKKNEPLSKFYLQQIADTLMINGGFLSNTGLYTGEMGLALFFFHYANYSENEAYWDYAFRLLGKVQGRIYEETPIDYKQGITGIGSAFEYLVQEGYIKANTDVILEAFDDRIFNIDNLPHLTFEDI